MRTGRFVVTLKEVLFSFLILGVMTGIGVWLCNPIIMRANKKATEVVSATRVTDSDNFDYIRRTNVGNFLAEGELICNDTIRLPELKGQYSKVEKVREEYCEHIQTYTTTDGKGHVSVHTRTYWSWDVKGRENFETKTFNFLGRNFTAKDIGYHIDTQTDTIIYSERKFLERRERYVYHTAPTTVKGMMRGVANDKHLNELVFMKDKTIEETVSRAEKREHNSPIVFWVLWGLITVAILTLFYALENKWLE